jgi:hypothetical protein
MCGERGRPLGAREPAGEADCAREPHDSRRARPDFAGEPRESREDRARTARPKIPRKQDARDPREDERAPSFSGAGCIARARTARAPGSREQRARPKPGLLADNLDWGHFVDSRTFVDSGCLWTGRLLWTGRAEFGRGIVHKRTASALQSWFRPFGGLRWVTDRCGALAGAAPEEVFFLPGRKPSDRADFFRGHWSPTQLPLIRNSL